MRKGFQFFQTILVFSILLSSSAWASKMSAMNFFQEGEQSHLEFVFDTPDVSIEAVREALKSASQAHLRDIMAYTDEPLVSSDFIHQTESLIIDGQQLMQVGSQYKVFAWYDNEWGYANRLLDMCLHLASHKKPIVNPL